MIASLKSQITQTMKFGIAKLPKTFYKNTEKKFKRKKNNSKELSSIKDRKVNTNFCYGGRKSFITWQIQWRCYVGPRGPYASTWFTKHTFLETLCKVKKTDNVTKTNNNIQSYLLN